MMGFVWVGLTALGVTGITFLAIWFENKREAKKKKAASDRIG